MRDISDKNIILFDGVCNLCNGAVNFIIDRDQEGIFNFASLQSEFGQEVLAHYQLPTDDYDSFIFLKKGKLLTRSSAALEVAKMLKGWSWLYGFVIVPRFIRDAVYKLIANNRYKMFGKQDSCRLPTPELKSRFI